MIYKNNTNKNINDVMRTEFTDELANFVWEHAVAPMCFVDQAGRFLRVNPALADLLGYTTSELIKFRFHDITHPQDIEADQEMLDACLAGKIDGYSMTKRYITKRGESVWVRLRVDAVKDTDTGELVLFLSQVTPKEDPIRTEAILKRHGRNSSIDSELLKPKQLTVAEIGTWLRENWKSVMPIFAGIGFVIFYVIKYLIEYIDKAGG